MNSAVDCFEVASFDHPFVGRPKGSTVHEGATIAEIVAAQGIEAHLIPTVQVVISRGVNSTVVPLDQWARVRPKAGSHVLIGPRVHGPALALLAGAALAPAAGYIAGTVFSLTAGTLAYTAVYAAVTVVGSLLISALIPPPTSPEQAQRDPNFTITGSSNFENRYGIFPTVLGRHLMYPPKTARGFTSGGGSTIYYHGRYTFGYGPVSLESLRIGTTPITEFRQVEIEFLNVDRAETLSHMPELEPMVIGWRQGNEAMQLYPDDVAEDVYSVKMNGFEPVVRNTRERAISASVDVTFQGLIIYNDKGESTDHTVRIGYRYRKVGATDWIDAGSDQHTGETASSIRVTRDITFDEPGEYEVEVTRLQGVATWAHQVSEDTFLTAIRSVQSGQIPSHPEIAEVAVRIRASDQLNGQLDSLNGIVQQMAPVWTGTEWTEFQPVRHPAWVKCRALMGPMLQNPLPDARLQLDDLLAWAQEEPHWTCDAVIDQPTTCAEVLDLICAAGRARRSLRDLNYSVVRDGGAGPVVQQFSPRNSYGFEASLTFPKEIHGFRVRFVSEALDWQQDEMVVYADGYDATTATELETLELRAVVLTKEETSGGNVWRLGRYHLAQVTLRPEEFSWGADIDHLRVQMGDKVRLVHDVPMVGVGWGRIKALELTGQDDIVAVLLDEDVSVVAGTYRMIVRRSDGSEVIFPAQPPSGPGGQWIPSGTPDGAGVAVGDLVLIEETTQESLEVLIRSVRNAGDFRATLTGVPAAPAVLLADQGTIPDYVPNISKVAPREVSAPPPPQVLAERLAFSANPALVEWVGDVVPQDQFANNRILAVLSLVETEEEISRQDFPSRDVRVTLPEYGEYRLTLYSKSVTGEMSQPVVLAVSFDEESGRPNDVEGFRIRILGDQAQLSWDGGDPLAATYHIKHLAPGAPGGWNEAVDVERAAIGQTAEVPAFPGVYLIKAVGVLGKYSENATVAQSNIVALAGFNVVRELSLHPEFAGELTAGMYRSQRGVQLLSGSTWADWPTWAETGVWAYQGDIAESGTFVSSEIVDLGAVMSSRVTASIDGYGFDLGDYWSDWGLWSEVGLWAGNVDGTWRIRLQVSTTDDDPQAPGATWSEWADLLAGDYLARAFRVRVVFASSNARVSAVLRALSVQIDVPDRILEGSDIVCPVEGIYVPFAPAFLDRPAIAVDGQGLPAGARSVRTQADRAGFRQQFLDDQDNGIACSFDYIAKGYGRLA